MKKLSWIAAAAVALAAAAWSVTVPPSDDSAYDPLENPMPPAQPHRPAPRTVVNTLDTHRVGTAKALASPRGPGSPSVAYRSYRQCRQHIDQNYLRLTTVRQIALECHSNAAYLSRVFKRYAHQTPDQYLLHLKRIHAAELGQQAT
jgi:hypothetical protein